MISESTLALDFESEIGSPVTAQDLRLWCVPAAILAVTDLADEEKLLFHAIRQAMPGGAKVLLTHVRPSGSASHRCRRKGGAGEGGAPLESTRSALDRMARQLRWVGIPCEPIMLRGVPAEEIPALVKSRGVDRIIVTNREESDPAQEMIAEEILPYVGVPVCMLGRRMPSSPRSEAPAGRITLALSLNSNCGLQLAFASRLAQEMRAKLTVMHVSDAEERRFGRIACTPEAVASRLPATALREADLLCPVEIVVREGDAANEILNHVNSVRQDFLTLGHVGALRPISTGETNVTRTILSGATCPVMLLGESITSSAHHWSRTVEQPKPPHGFYS